MADHALKQRRPVDQNAPEYDINNLKLKLRSESEHQYNSPWNIAADFKVDMSFSESQIAGMLEEYEADHGTEMNMLARLTSFVARL